MTSRNRKTNQTADDSGAQAHSSDDVPEDQNRAAEIARLAYEKWQARGCPDGDDRRDWFAAEQEVIAAGRQPSTGREGLPSRARR